MPPKRKTAAGEAEGEGVKKAKTEVPDAAEKLKAEDKKVGGKKSHKMDTNCPVSEGSVHEDYDCMLNQTNVKNNNNKFYAIQVIRQGTDFFCRSRWGRVGVNGDTKLKGTSDAASAIKMFEKMFKEKTKNAWVKRDSFVSAEGKYTLIEMDDEDEDTVDDLKNMPLGKLRKGQVAKGFEVLDDIEKEGFEVLDEIEKERFEVPDEIKKEVSEVPDEIEKEGSEVPDEIEKEGSEVPDEIEKDLTANNDVKENKQKRLMNMSSKFYTVIPHDFGRQRPPVLDNEELLRNKRELLNSWVAQRTQHQLRTEAEDVTISIN